MEQVIGLIVRLAQVLIGVIDVAMLVRAVTSWFPNFDGEWLKIVYLFTESIIAPVRALFDRLKLFVNSPIDVPFVVSYLLVLVAQSTLDNIDIALI